MSITVAVALDLLPNLKEGISSWYAFEENIKVIYKKKYMISMYI